MQAIMSVLTQVAHGSATFLTSLSHFLNVFGSSDLNQFFFALWQTARKPFLFCAESFCSEFPCSRATLKRNRFYRLAGNVSACPNQPSTPPPPLLFPALLTLRLVCFSLPSNPLFSPAQEEERERDTPCGQQVTK